MNKSETYSLESRIWTDIPLSSIRTPPKKEQVIGVLGDYQLIRQLGQGGMGQVFLAYDPICGRYIALKKIRPDLKKNTIIARFLRESKLTSQLAHPSIIPIYSMHQDGEEIYYTMPYIEGKTLKEILREQAQFKENKNRESPPYSLSDLIQIFLKVCQAVQYAHAHGVLHRDIKPENIIIGNYGEVFLLDWGVAQLFGENSQEEKSCYEEVEGRIGITLAGKIVGTVNYLSPERILGGSATIATEIYALGIILYQIITLQMPFRRKSIKEARHNLSQERIPNPSVIAPYHEIPHILMRVTKKCILRKAENRYKSVEDLILDLNTYVSGISEWFPAANLSLERVEDWLFQENLLLRNYTAIARSVSYIDWVQIMVSSQEFSGNVRLSARIKVDKNCKGIGFLMNVSKDYIYKNGNEGYFLWLNNQSEGSSQLRLGNVVIENTPKNFLKSSEWRHISMEKVDNTLSFFLDDELIFYHHSDLPLPGRHLGLVVRDYHFQIEDLSVSVGSWNIKVNCLAVPDALFTHKNYEQALALYRRISVSFPGSREERQAIFSAGSVLLSQACAFTAHSDILFDSALEEFSKLKQTIGAPLEYLGKSYVYQALGDYAEQMKCLTFGSCRYAKHPMVSVLHEQLISCIYDYTKENRYKTYNALLSVIIYVPTLLRDHSLKDCLKIIIRGCELLPLFPKISVAKIYKGDGLSQFYLGVHLAFWLKRSDAILELCDRWFTSEYETETEQEKWEMLPIILLYMLKINGKSEVVVLLQKILEEYKELVPEVIQNSLRRIELFTSITPDGLENIVISWKNSESHSNEHDPYSVEEWGYLVEYALLSNSNTTLAFLEEWAKNALLDAQKIESYQLIIALIKQEQKRINMLATAISENTDESSIIFFLKGCSLRNNSEASYKEYFSEMLPSAWPFTWQLGAQYIAGRISEEPASPWMRQAFFAEQQQLFFQLYIFYHCVHDIERTNQYRLRAFIGYTHE